MPKLKIVLLVVIVAGLLAGGVYLFKKYPKLQAFLPGNATQQRLAESGETPLGGGETKTGDTPTNDTATGDTTTETPEWWQTCKKEDLYEYLGVGKMRITGKENFTVKNTTVELCCYETIPLTDEYMENAMKTCMVVSQPEDGAVAFEKKGGTYVPVMATFAVDGKKCVFNYGESGVLEGEYCEQ
jgi:hypothetical protein